MGKTKQFDREKFFRAISRAINGAVPRTRPHSSKKGKRGYSRVQGKKVEAPQCDSG